MPAPNSKASSNANGKAKSITASTSGTATPVTSKDTSDSLTTFAGGKPDKKAYEEEQAKIKAEIDSLQAQLVTEIYLFISQRAGNTHSLTSEHRP